MKRGGTIGGDECIVCGGEDRGGRVCVVGLLTPSSPVSSWRAGSEAGSVASEDKSTFFEDFGTMGGWVDDGTVHVAVAELCECASSLWGAAGSGILDIVARRRGLSFRNCASIPGSMAQ